MTQQTLFSSDESPNQVERWQFSDYKAALSFANELCKTGKYGGIKILPVADGSPDRVVRAVKL